MNQVEQAADKAWIGILNLLISTHVHLLLRIMMPFWWASNARQALAAIIFIVDIICHFQQIHHVCAHQHVSQGKEVTVLKIFN